MKIRSETIIFATKRKKNSNKQEKQLETEISILESNFENLTGEENIDLNLKKEKLENIRTDKIKGIIFRSKAKWYEEGEKNTEYFLNLGKRNYISKDMKEFINNQNHVLTNRSEIMH